MAGFKLDFSKFKHIKSDKHSTHLQHDDGHSIVLAHNALDKHTQEQLKALSNVGSEAQTPNQKQEAQAESKSAPRMKAEGGVIPEEMPNMYAEGTGDVEIPEGGVNVDTSGPPQIQDPRALPPLPPQAEIDKLKLENSTPLVQAGLVPESEYTPPAAPGAGLPTLSPEKMEAKEEQGIAPTPTAPDPTAKATNGIASAEANELAGAKAKAEAVGALGQEQAAIHEKQAAAQQDAISSFQKASQESENDYNTFKHDIANNHIDPANYWKDHSKLMTGIGIILAGFNPTSNPNAAVNFLKFQMEQNLQAQTAELGKKQNLLSANLAHYKNMRDAADMTRLQQEAYVSHKLDQAAATTQSPMAKAAALSAKGAIQKEYIPLKMQMDMRRAMMSLTQSGNPDAQGAAIASMSSMPGVNPEQIKTYKEAFVPGIGMSKSLTPVPQAAREQLLAHHQLDAAANDVLNFSKTHTNLIPGTPAYVTGVQKSTILQQKIREGLLGTVFRESEKPLLEKFVDDNPAGFMKSLRTQPKLMEILNANKRDLDSLKQSYGLPIQEQHKTSAQPQIKIVNGVKYMRGPKGEAIKVP